jgi:hypothetical protein
MVSVKLLKMTQSIDGKVMGVDDRDLQLRVLRGRCKMSAMMCRIMPVTSKEVRVRTSGSGSSKVLNPDPSKGPGLAICMNLNLNIGSGSGANPVHRVREPDRGQSTCTCAPLPSTRLPTLTPTFCPLHAYARPFFCWKLALNPCYALQGETGMIT